MKKYYPLFLAAIAALFALSACAPTNPGNISSLSVNGTGFVNLEPDIAYVYLGVRTESESVSDAVEENTSKSEAVSGILQELGVEKLDIQTTAYNVYPMQEYDVRGEPIESKYVVENIVRVVIRDLKELGKLLDAVVDAGVNNINSVQFDVEDKEQALSDARMLAIQNARQQAEEIAAAADVTLGEVISLNVYSGSGGPMPFYGEKMFAVGAGGGGDVPISSGQLTITADANILYEIK